MLRLNAYGETHVGHRRVRQEDAFTIAPMSCYVVCDGIGGGRAGDVASTLAVASVVESLAAATDTAAKERLINAIKWANTQVFVAGRAAATRDMGSTIVALHVHDESLAIAHVGDSRIYRFREGVLTCLTRDHNNLRDIEDLIADFRKEGQEPDSVLLDYKDSEWANVMTRCVGGESTIEIDVQSLVPQHGDLYLLCSDGLTGMVSDREISDLLAHADAGCLDIAVSALIQAALTEGGDDNVTVILVACVATKD